MGFSQPTITGTVTADDSITRTARSTSRRAATRFARIRSRPNRTDVATHDPAGDEPSADETHREHRHAAEPCEQHGEQHGSGCRWCAGAAGDGAGFGAFR